MMDGFIHNLGAILLALAMPRHSAQPVQWDVNIRSWAVLLERAYIHSRSLILLPSLVVPYSSMVLLFTGLITEYSLLILSSPGESESSNAYQHAPPPNIARRIPARAY